MAKILSSSYDKNFMMRVWHRFRRQDSFTQFSLATMMMLLVATPIIITSRQILTQQAAEISYISPNGTGKDSVFTISDLDAIRVTPYLATISWNSSAKATGKLKYWEDSLFSNIFSTFFGPAVEDTNLTSHHTLSTAGDLKPGTTYRYKVYTETQYGDKFESSTYTFTTPPR